MNLNPRQSRFCALYIKYGNASRAYKEAYSRPDITSDISRARGWELLQKPYIRDEVNRLQMEESNKHGIDREFAIQFWLGVINDANETFDLAKLKDANKEEVKRFYRMMQLTKNSDKIQAGKELFRMLGLDKPKGEKTDDAIINIHLNEHKSD